MPTAIAPGRVPEHRRLMTTSPVPIPSPHPLPVASWRLPTGFRGWARLVQAALVVDMLASAVTAGVLFAQRSQLGRFRAGTPIARFTDLAEGERQATVAGGFTLLLVLLTGILWLVWWAKAHRAASERRGDLRYGRGWAIGGWFVPFASFVVPKRVADDLWTAAHEPHHPRDDVIRSGWVLGWWAAWITSSVTSLGIRGGTTASD